MTEEACWEVEQCSMIMQFRGSKRANFIWGRSSLLETQTGTDISGICPGCGRSDGTHASNCPVAHPPVPINPPPPPKPPPPPPPEPPPPKP